VIKDWIKNHLIPEKRESGLWPGFADSLQTVYEEQVEPLLNRLSARKSFFTMHPDDLDTRIGEYGRFFIIGDTGSASRPILLTQRLDEVHFKGTDRPIIATFWREFGNLPVKWEPLYAPVDQEKHPYGSFFTNANGVEIARETFGEFFLTSRGTINVDLNSLYEIYGYEEQDQLVRRLTFDFDRIVAPLLPLETVFDGISLRLEFFLQDAPEMLVWHHTDTKIIRPFLFKTTMEKLTQQHVSIKTAMDIRPTKRNTETILLTHDAMPLDAWLIDLPVILPSSNA